MPEYDAFGNKVEDGATTPAPSGAPTPSPTPTATPTPIAPEETPAPTGLKLSGRPSRFSGGFSGGPWIAVVVMIAVIGGGALIAYNAINDTKDTIRSFAPQRLPGITVQTPETPGTSNPAKPAKPAKPKPPPVGLDARSLIRHAAFASAVAKLRKGNYGRVTYIRVAPERIDTQMVTGSGRLRNIQVGVEGDVHQFGPLSSPGFKPPTIAYADIDTSAPERLVRGGVRNGGVKSDGIDYLVVSKFGDQVIWNAYFKNNVRYQGDSSGRVQRKF